MRCPICNHDEAALQGCGACIGPKKAGGRPCACGRGPTTRDITAGFVRSARAGEQARYEAVCAACADERQN